MPNSDDSEEFVEIHGFKIAQELAVRHYMMFSDWQKHYEVKSLFELTQELRLPIYRFWHIPSMFTKPFVSTIQYFIDSVQLEVKLLTEKPFLTNIRQMTQEEIKTLELKTK